MSNFRNVEITDVEKVKELHAKYSKHDLDWNNILYHAIIERNNKIIAYGSIRKIHELNITLDHSKSVRERSDCIATLLNAVEYVKEIDKINEIVAFAEPDFANILVKHFGLVRLFKEALIF